MNKTMFITILIVSVFAAGCNTSRGIGQDVENTGHNIKKTADRND
jgi:predicted small secreted protein